MLGHYFPTEEEQRKRNEFEKACKAHRNTNLPFNYDGKTFKYFEHTPLMFHPFRFKIHLKSHESISFIRENGQWEEYLRSETWKVRNLIKLYWTIKKKVRGKNKRPS